MSESRMTFTIAVGCAFCSLKMDSTTDSSVEVVSSPQNATQSLTMSPPPITSLPRFTVPAYRPTTRARARNDVGSGPTQPLSSRLRRVGNRTYHERDLEKRRELVLVLHARARVHEAALVAQAAVRPDQHLVGDRVPEDLHLERVGDDLLSFLEKGPTQWVAAP